MRVLILGAGFGGLELATRLSEGFGAELDVVLIDRSEHFVFGYSKLDVMFGRATPAQVRHRYDELGKPGLRFVSSVVRAIDPANKRVSTDAGDFEADVLVIALGADLHPESTPGLVEGGHEFYTVAGAFAARDVLADFTGGRVVVAVTSTPFKCPPAPSETALLLHDFLSGRGLRESSSISLVMPLPTPIPPSPEASQALLQAFAERGIEWRPNTLVRRLEPDRKVAVLGDGSELGYDLLLAVPPHRVPSVVAESGLAVDGWIPVDPLTLQTSVPGVFAIGDVTSVGTPKAGVFAEGQAAVVADRIRAMATVGGEPATYDGRGVCYVEFGRDQFGRDNVGRVDVTFVAGRSPYGSFDAPSAEYRADKQQFGSSRISRWFGHDWPSPLVGQDS